MSLINICNLLKPPEIVHNIIIQHLAKSCLMMYYILLGDEYELCNSFCYHLRMWNKMKQIHPSDTTESFMDAIEAVYCDVLSIHEHADWYTRIQQHNAWGVKVSIKNYNRVKRILDFFLPLFKVIRIFSLYLCYK